MLLYKREGVRHQPTHSRQIISSSDYSKEKSYVISLLDLSHLNLHPTYLYHINFHRILETSLYAHNLANIFDRVIKCLSRQYHLLACPIYPEKSVEISFSDTSYYISNYSPWHSILVSVKNPSKGLFKDICHVSSCWVHCGAM